MRINILLAGGLIVVLSVLFLPSEVVASIFGFVLGGFDIVIGALISRTVGVFVPNDQSGPLKLLLDKGVVGTSIYIVAFSGSKVVLRKLGSAKITVATALVLALSGAAIAGYFGIIVGGITAFSLQEFVTERRRENVKRQNILDPSGKNDVSYSYDELEQFQLLGNRILLYFKDRILRIAISRKYSRTIEPVLERIIPVRIRSKPVPSGKDP